MDDIQITVPAGRPERRAQLRRLRALERDAQRLYLGHLVLAVEQNPTHSGLLNWSNAVRADSLLGPMYTEIYTS